MEESLQKHVKIECHDLLMNTRSIYYKFIGLYLENKYFFSDIVVYEPSSTTPNQLTPISTKCLLWILIFVVRFQVLHIFEFVESGRLWASYPLFTFGIEQSRVIYLACIHQQRSR